MRLVKEQSKPDLEVVMDSALKQVYEIPAHQHSTFTDFLKDQSLTIEVWDADSQVNYGFSRVSLNRLLR